MDYTQLQAMDIIFKSYFALDSTSGLPISTGYSLVADGIGGIVWQSPVESLSTFGGSAGYSNLDNLPVYLSTKQAEAQALSTTTYSTLNWLVSSYGLYSTQVTSDQLRSTVETLGSIGYLSTSGLYSLSTSVSTNTGNINILFNLVSTNTGTISSLYGGISSFVSTSIAQSISTSLSTYTGAYLSPALANLGTPSNGNPGNAWISSFTLQSTIANLSSLGYVTNTQLTSTVNNLGSVGYISSTSLASGLTSTFQAASTLVNSQVYLENISQVRITNSQVNFGSNTVSISYLSTLYLSSIPYSGTLGRTGYSNAPNDIVFSSLSIDMSKFTPYITSTSRIFIDYYPTFQFSRISDNATNIPILEISTLIQQGTTLYTDTVHRSPFIACTPPRLQLCNAAVEGSNVFSQPIRMQLSTGQILAAPTTPISFYHRVSGGISISLGMNSLHTSSLFIYAAPSNSVFLTIHNPPY